MFYEVANADRESLRALGLRYNPFKAIVAPRPIGWITTVDREGQVNLAPFSFFNAVASDPPMVFYAANGVHESAGTGEKDSLSNVRATGEFVCNLSTWEQRNEMNLTSAAAPRGVDEMDAVGLKKLPSRLVRAPRVAGAPAHLECKLHQVVDLPRDPATGQGNYMVIGMVVGVHLDDAFVRDGLFDTARAQPIARLGYHDYAVVTEAFAMKRPGWPLDPKG